MSSLEFALSSIAAALVIVWVTGKIWDWKGAVVQEENGAELDAAGMHTLPGASRQAVNQNQQEEI